MYPSFVPQSFDGITAENKARCSRSRSRQIASGSMRQFFNQVTDVFNAPGGAAFREFHRLGKSPRFDSLPPACFAEWNETQNLR